MKVSLMQLCECCGHPLGELLVDKFQKWSWHQGKEFKVRLKSIPMGEDERPILAELTIVMEDDDP